MLNGGYSTVMEEEKENLLLIWFPVALSIFFRNKELRNTLTKFKQALLDLVLSLQAFLIFLRLPPSSLTMTTSDVSINNSNMHTITNTIKLI